MLKHGLAFILCLSVASASLAQEAPAAAELESRVREMQRQIEILITEIEALKNRQADKPVAADTEQFGLGAAASKVYRAQPGVSFGGYGEFLYQNIARRNDAGAGVSARDSADQLRAILYTGYKFNDRILFNSETEFEHGSTGAGGEVSVEFAYLDFLARPDLGFRAGLLLVPMGFINEQHEPTAYLGSRRPLVERTIIPATWREMGAGMFGENGPVSWRAYLTTGLNAARFTSGGIRSGRGNGAQSLAEDFALTGRIDYQPVVGTTLGASAYSGDSGQRAVANGAELKARVTMYELHAESRLRGLQLRGLWTRGTIDDAAAVNALNKLTGANSVGESFGGWYGEIGYDLASFRGFGERSITPFVRYEKLNPQRSVPTGFSLNRALDQAITTMGLQWKPISQTVIKADYQNVDNEAGTGTNQWNVSLGYIF